jgi:hypothetical protein
MAIPAFTAAANVGNEAVPWRSTSNLYRSIRATWFRVASVAGSTSVNLAGEAIVGILLSCGSGVRFI